MATRKSQPEDSGPDDSVTGEIQRRPPDPFVRARRPDPTGDPTRTVTLSGLLGDSDRSGRRRLYLTTRLDYYAEFENDAVIVVEDIAADQPPFVGLDATRVELRRDARIDFVTSRIASEHDEFDLDIRRSAPISAALRFGPPRILPPFDRSFFVCQFTATTVCNHATCTDPITAQQTFEVSCAATCDDTCGGTCDSCYGTCGEVTCGATCAGVTCEGSCAGTCGEATCHGTCGRQTCGTCGEATCGRETCNTCGRATCRGHTCFGTCGEATCFGTCGEATCEGVTCGPTCDGATCVGTCQGLTCEGTCNVSCRGTCGGTCDFACQPSFGPNPCFISRQC